MWRGVRVTKSVVTETPPNVCINQCLNMVILQGLKTTETLTAF